MQLHTYSTPVPYPVWNAQGAGAATKHGGAPHLHTSHVHTRAQARTRARVRVAFRCGEVWRYGVRHNDNTGRQ